MDFSKILTVDLEKALKKAIDAEDMANALLFEAELKKRASENGADTNMVEQGVSGLYEGLAKGAGGPVDLLTAGLNKLGANIENPVGGRESIESLFQALSNQKAISEVEPQTAAQRIARGTGQVLGETVPATTAIVAAGPKALSMASDTTYAAFKNALAQVRGEATKAPVAFAATEASTAVGGGLAEKSVAEVLPDNPTAQMVANILGAVAGGKVSEVPERLMQSKVTGPLTAEELKQEAGRLYDRQREQGLSAQPEVTQAIESDVFSYLDQAGYLAPVKGSNRVIVATDYTKLRPVYKMLEAYAEKGMTAANIQTLRRSIAGRMRDAKGEERNALRNVLRIFDENTAQLAPEIKVANAMYARAMKAEQIEDLQELASTTAQSANGDMENALRQEFRGLLRKIIRGTEKGWSKDEVDQLKQIVEGGSAENMMRFIGKFKPRGVVSAGLGAGVPFGLAMNVTGDPIVSGTVAGGVAATGYAGQAAGAALQQQNIDRLYQSIVQGRNMTPAAQMRLRAALTSYLAGQAAAQ
jgi:hypothetical protein